MDGKEETEEEEGEENGKRPSLPTPHNKVPWAYAIGSLLTLSEPALFWYPKDQGLPYWKWYQARPLYTHSLPLKLIN